MKPFDNTYIPYGLKICLKKVLSFHTLYNQNISEIYEIESLVSSYEWFEEGKVVWFEYHYKSNNQPYYINIFPGEFSLKKPEGTNVIIKRRNMPLQQKSSLIEEFLKYLKTMQVEEISNENKLLADILKGKFERIESEEIECTNYFKTTALRLRSAKSRAEVELLFSQLFSSLYKNYKMSLSKFSSCILLIQVQLEFSFWIEQDAYNEPEVFFYSFIKLMLSKGINISDKISNLGNYYYQLASSHLDSALNCSSIEAHIEKLRMAAHFYWCSLLLIRSTNIFHVKNDLDYEELIAEEGWACSLTGLSYYTFVFDKPDHYPKIVAEGLKLSGHSYESTFLSKYSSHAHPDFPRIMAKIFIAHGKVIAGAPYFEDGLTELLRLEADFGIIEPFDQWIIKNAILEAARLSDNQSLAEQYSSKLIGQMMVASSFGE